MQSAINTMGCCSVVRGRLTIATSCAAWLILIINRQDYCYGFILPQQSIAKWNGGGDKRNRVVLSTTRTSTSDSNYDRRNRMDRRSKQQSAMSQLPLKNLVDILRVRGVACSEDMPRSKLEELLRNDLQRQQQQAITTMHDSSNTSRTRQRKPPTRRKRTQRLSFDHSHAAAELRNSSSHINADETPIAIDEEYLEKLPLSELLEKLDSKGIQYPAIATRKELQLLLLSKSSAASSTYRIDDAKPENVVANNGTDPQKSSNETIPITDLISKLDSLNVRYPVTATRQELEEILKRALKNKRTSPPKVVANQKVTSAEGRTVTHPYATAPSRQEKQRNSKKKKPPLWKRVVRTSRKTLSEKVGTTAQRTARRAVQQARKVQRQAIDILATDEDGVRDVAFEYVIKDKHQPSSGVKPVIDVPFVVEDDDEEEEPPVAPRNIKRKRANVQPTSSSPPHSVRKERPASASSPPLRPSQPRKQRPRNQRAEESNEYENDRYTPVEGSATRPRAQSRQLNNREPRHRRGSNGRPQAKRSRPHARHRQQEHLSGRQRLLPPSTKPFGNNTNTTSAQSTSFTGGPKPRRKVYSQYDSDREDDALDRFGAFLADTADRIMWGRYDDDEDEAANTGGTADAPTKKEKKQSSARSRRRGDYRHWKDRLEERFDSVLGIKEDSEYYRSWTEKDIADEDTDGHFSVLDLAQGKHRRRKKRRQPKHLYDRAAWEEEGSLMSLLFGRTPSGSSLLYEELLDQRTGSVVNVVRAGGKSLLLVSGYACRWASVRGALPQPVVVLGVAAAGICSRRRVRAVATTLIVMRMVGEILHGYLVGEQDWEPEEEEELDEE